MLTKELVSSGERWPQAATLASPLLLGIYIKIVLEHMSGISDVL